VSDNTLNAEAAGRAAMAGAWGAVLPAEAPTADEKLWGMLANVLGLVFLIGPVAVLLLKGNSKFVKFNALQMICWSVVGIAVSVVLGVCFTVLAAVPFVGLLVIRILSPLISLCFLGLLVFLALKANQGILFRLPFIGPFAYGKSYES